MSIRPRNLYASPTTEVSLRSASSPQALPLPPPTLLANETPSKPSSQCPRSPFTLATIFGQSSSSENTSDTSTGPELLTDKQSTLKPDPAAEARARIEAFTKTGEYQLYLRDKETLSRSLDSLREKPLQERIEYFKSKETRDLQMRVVDFEATLVYDCFLADLEYVRNR